MSRKRKAESQLTPESADVESSVTHVEDSVGDTAEQIAARPPLRARRRGQTGPVNWDEMKEAANTTTAKTEPTPTPTTTTTTTTTPSENATAPPAAPTPATATEIASESVKQPIIEPTEESATDQVKPVVQEVDEPVATSDQSDSTTTSDKPDEPAKPADENNITPSTTTATTTTTATPPSATTTPSPFFKIPEPGAVKWSLNLAGATNPFSESGSSDLFKSNQPSTFSSVSQDNGIFLNTNKVIDFKLPINAPASISESKPKPIVEEEANLETGEEAENKLFSTTVKLFQLVTKEESGEKNEESKESAPLTKEWVERGTGELRFNVHKSDKSKSRVIVRTEKIHKLVINMFLFKNIVCNTVNDKSIRLVGFNLVEKDNPSPESYLLKFRNPADCSGLFKLIDEYKGYSPELKVNA